MKFQKKKDIKRRKAFLKYESKRIFSKYLLSQTTLTQNTQKSSHNESTTDENLMQTYQIGTWVR